MVCMVHRSQRKHRARIRMVLVSRHMPFHAVHHRFRLRARETLTGASRNVFIVGGPRKRVAHLNLSRAHLQGMGLCLHSLQLVCRAPF